MPQKTMNALDALLSAATVTRRTVPLSSLKPHPRNYRQHPPEQLRKLVKSYKRFGQFRSLVAIADPADPGTYFIVAGEGFDTAMNQAGATEAYIDELPLDTPEDMVLGIMVADNLHSEQAVDDTELLSKLLKEQQGAGFDLESLGSDEETLRQMLSDVSREHATDFLDDILHGKEGEEEEEEEEEGTAHLESEALFQLNYTVTAEQRAHILEAIKTAKILWNIQTSMDALVYICQQFSREHRKDHVAV